MPFDTRCNKATCVFESGRSHGSVPFRRNSAILAFNLCARTIVRGMHSSVSLVAYPNIKPCGGRTVTVFTGKIFKSKLKNNPTTDLVPCSNILFIAINMNTLSNVRRLLLQGHKNIAGLVVKTCKGKQLKSPPSQNIARLKPSTHVCTHTHTFTGVIVSNLTDCFTNYFLIVHGGM